MHSACAGAVAHRGRQIEKSAQAGFWGRGPFPARGVDPRTPGRTQLFPNLSLAAHTHTHNRNASRLSRAERHTLAAGAPPSLPSGPGPALDWPRQWRSSRRTRRRRRPTWRRCMARTSGPAGSKMGERCEAGACGLLWPGSIAHGVAADGPARRRRQQGDRHGRAAPFCADRPPPPSQHRSAAQRPPSARAFRERGVAACEEHALPPARRPPSPAQLPGPRQARSRSRPPARRRTPILHCRRRCRGSGPSGLRTTRARCATA